jgi:hypothetical protein
MFHRWDHVPIYFQQSDTSLLKNEPFQDFLQVQTSSAFRGCFTAICNIFFLLTPIFEMHIILGLKLHHYYKDPPLELPYYGEDGNP